MIDWKSEARKLLDQHGLKNWSFSFDRAKRRAGCCNYRKKTITLSVYYVASNTEEDIRNTILHEAAHALTPGCHHNQQWKEMCKLIGARPERCYRDNVVMPKGKWKADCPLCKNEYHKHRKPRGTYICVKCGKNGVLVFRKAC